jgi:hypothetical protein
LRIDYVTGVVDVVVGAVVFVVVVVVVDVVVVVVVVTGTVVGSITLPPCPKARKRTAPALICFVASISSRLTRIRTPRSAAADSNLTSVWFEPESKLCFAVSAMLTSFASWRVPEVGPSLPVKMKLSFQPVRAAPPAHWIPSPGCVGRLLTVVAFSESFAPAALPRVVC